MDFSPVLPIIGPATGWAAFLGLAIYMVRGYVTGATLTRREADGIEKRNTYLESALSKTQDALVEEQKTGKVVRHFIESLDRSTGS